MNGVPQRQFPWTAAIIAAAMVLIVAMGLRACVKAGRGVRQDADKVIQLGAKAIEAAPEIAAKFKAGTITHTFRESLPDISSTKGDILEVAIARADETFTRSDKRTIAWDRIYLGTTVAEIRVPATFRYHVRLSDRWVLTTRSNVCLVLAPQIRPSLPPAIDTGRMEKRAESGWARFDKAEVLDELERSVTGTLTERAMDPVHLRAVREPARKAVAEFVRNWLLREDHWRQDRFTAVVVVFPDEAPSATEEELSLVPRDPTLRLTPQGQ